MYEGKALSCQNNQMKKKYKVIIHIGMHGNMFKLQDLQLNIRKVMLCRGGIHEVFFNTSAMFFNPLHCAGFNLKSICTEKQILP